jgi:flagellar biosynthesis GTPase FlhF
LCHKRSNKKRCLQYRLDIVSQEKQYLFSIILTYEEILKSFAMSTTTGIAALSTAQEKRSWIPLKIKTPKKIGIKSGTICIILCATFLTLKLYTGVYDEMRELEDTGEAPGDEKPLTEEEEEKLLTPSDTEAEPDADPDTDTVADLDPDAEMHSGDKEEARLRAEREAEKADMEQMERERKERIRRKKKEREDQRLEQKLREEEALENEKARIRREIEAEAQAKIEKLESELKKAQEVSDSGDGSGVKRKMENQQRERMGSQDSRHESTATSAFGANLLNLPAGYRAVRSAKISSLAVRLLSGGSAIPYQPIGSFANDTDARI